MAAAPRKPKNDLTAIAADVGADIERLLAALRSNMAAAKKEGAAAVAKSMLLTRDVLGAITPNLDEISELLELHKKVVVPEAFESEDVKTINVAGHRITVSERVLASIVKEDRTGAFSWLKQNGLGDLIFETVNAQTLSSAVKDRLEQGLTVDDAVIKVHYQPTTSITKVKT